MVPVPASRLLWWGGLTAAACGAVLCVLGWYGISGERFAERQLPYLASCTVPGAALLVAGAVLVAAAGRGSDDRQADRQTDPQAARQAEDARSEQEAPRSGPSSDGPPLRVPGGTLAHRPDCPLVAGKPGAVPVGDTGLAPCPVCEPQG